MVLVQLVSSRDGRRNPATATALAGRARGADRGSAATRPPEAAHRRRRSGERALRGRPRRRARPQPSRRDGHGGPAWVPRRARPGAGPASPTRGSAQASADDRRGHRRRETVASDAGTVVERGLGLRAHRLPAGRAGRRRLGRAAVPGRRRLAPLHSHRGPTFRTSSSAGPSDQPKPGAFRQAGTGTFRGHRVVWIETVYRPEGQKPSLGGDQVAYDAATHRPLALRTIERGGRFKGRTFSYFALKLLPNLPPNGVNFVVPDGGAGRNTPNPLIAITGHRLAAARTALGTTPLWLGPFVPRGTSAVGRGGPGRHGRQNGEDASAGSVRAVRLRQLRSQGVRPGSAVVVRAGSEAGHDRSRGRWSPSLVTECWSRSHRRGRSSASTRRPRSRSRGPCARCPTSAPAGAAPRTRP